MNSSIRKYFFLFFLLNAGIVFAQDTTQTYGKIKISKGPYCKAFALYSFYGRSGKEKLLPRNEIVQPLPAEVFSIYVSNFNFSAFFTEHLKIQNFNLKGKNLDTVKISIKILANRQVYFEEIKSQKNQESSDDFHSFCLNLMKDTKWDPAYFTRSIGKGSRMLLWNKKLDAIGVMTVVFSAKPFEKQE